MNRHPSCIASPGTARASSHAHAQRLLNTLNGDPDMIAQLSRYIDHEASLERLDSPSVARLANAADRRSCEAIARAVTLADDVASLKERIDALRASQSDLEAILIEALANIEGKSSMR